MPDTRPRTRQSKGRTAVLQTIGKVLTEAGFAPKPFAQEGLEGFAVDLKHELYEAAMAYVVKGEDRFVFVVDLHDRGKKSTLPAMAEFIARANYGMLVGNFEMDYADASARFRSSVDYQGDELSAALVRNIVLAAGDTCQCYAPALAQVMKGKKTAMQAIAQVEAPEG